MYQHSVALSENMHRTLAGHLLRTDGQEDICLATYSLSTGAARTTRLLQTGHLPAIGDRAVHGNATIMGGYVLRVATLAAQLGLGVAVLHSHPGARGWQGLSTLDFQAEAAYAAMVRQVTGLPLLGLTLAGDHAWSARIWLDEAPTWAGSVRRVGANLSVSWNDAKVPVPTMHESQLRTISAWSESLQRDITRLRVLVVGAGSVGLDIVQRLAATGLVEIGVMDFDRVDEVNRDRMIGTTRRDARRRRRKVDVAARLARRAATGSSVGVNTHYTSVCTPDGLAAALDYDVIFSCVDRPWPRAVLNAIAYADLIPVIDGGIAIDTFDDGTLRGATRRTQTATPGRPCLACSGQLDPAEVALEMSGDLDDPEYIRRAGREQVSGRPNVAALCAGVSASQLEHFVSLIARPGGQGVPLPLRFSLAVHHLERRDCHTNDYCYVEKQVACGDDRIDLTREVDVIGRRNLQGGTLASNLNLKPALRLVHRILGRGLRLG
jgi:molybdopterin/thiamine biosynthesis adenylyltransferase